MTDKQKKIIDDMNYYDMLKRWRFAGLGDIMFFGDTGLYYSDIMKEKSKLFTTGQKVAISKSIGW